MTITEVQNALAAVQPMRDGNERRRIQECLAILIERGLLAAHREHDHERISLPTKVSLYPIIKKRTQTTPEMPPWHPDLADLSDVWRSTSEIQRHRYAAINRWLHSNPDLTPIPLRERALEIFTEFGKPEHFTCPEKALDAARSGPLFGTRDRLHAVLHTIPLPPPLLTKQPLRKLTDDHFQRVGHGNLLLVVENSTTWWSIVNALPDQHNLGFVAWGLGNSFSASIRSLETHRDSAIADITEVRYFGDLDPAGLHIPTRAALTALKAIDLPPVRPATRLYAALLDVGHPWPGTEDPLTEQRATALADWLIADQRRAVTELLTTGSRIAQEWVGTRYLKRSHTWYSDIR